VPIEGKPTDEESVSLACVLGKRDKSEILLLYVIEVRRNLPLDAEMATEVGRGEEILERVQRFADKAGFRAQTDLLQAREAGSAIVSEAVEREADLVVMGVPYAEKFGEYCVEARAQFVLENAPCRVILTREPLAKHEARAVTAGAR
jgi:nucleotide-binding universal stress UspA family protein